jgi:hypothetical protein
MRRGWNQSLPATVPRPAPVPLEYAVDVLPEGRLPFEIPRSVDAVRNSDEDVANDTADQLFQ